MGDPKDASTTMGALVSNEHLNKVKGFVATARNINATIHCGEGVDSVNLEDKNSKVRMGNGPSPVDLELLQ